MQKYLPPGGTFWQFLQSSRNSVGIATKFATRNGDECRRTTSKCGAAQISFPDDLSPPAGIQRMRCAAVAGRGRRSAGRSWRGPEGRWKVQRVLAARRPAATPRDPLPLRCGPIKKGDATASPGLNDQVEERPKWRCTSALPPSVPEALGGALCRALPSRAFDP